MFCFKIHTEKSISCAERVREVSFLKIMNIPPLALKSVQKQERKDMTKYDGNKGNM